MCYNSGGEKTMISVSDRNVLRDLAHRVAGIAALPVMDHRRELWRRHNRLRGERPMILVFPEGAWQELIPAGSLRCEGDRARQMEIDLRRRIYGYEHFASDNVVEATWLVAKVLRNSGWGLQAKRVHSGEQRGAWAFDPQIRTPDDLALLHFPEIEPDEERSAANLAEAEELFGDILDVRPTGVKRISFHLMNLWTGWRGYTETLLDMAVDPEFVHLGMRFLTDGYLHLLDQYERYGLLTSNSDDTYHASGGVSYSDELPPAGTGAVGREAMWASAETQEMAAVSPEMHAEFCQQYEARLLAGFGLTGYGCCEPLHDRLDDVFRLPNLRRISISPFADVDRAAAGLANRAIFSWKPQPAMLVGTFDSPAIERYLQHTVDVAGEGSLELILKDTHTCEHHPERFDEWTRIARRIVEAA